MWTTFFAHPGRSSSSSRNTKAVFLTKSRVRKNSGKRLPHCMRGYFVGFLSIIFAFAFVISALNIFTPASLSMLLGRPNSIRLRDVFNSWMSFHSRTIIEPEPPGSFDPVERLTFLRRTFGSHVQFMTIDPRT